MRHPDLRKEGISPARVRLRRPKCAPGLDWHAGTAASRAPPQRLPRHSCLSTAQRVPGTDSTPILFSVMSLRVNEAYKQLLTLVCGRAAAFFPSATEGWQDSGPRQQLCIRNTGSGLTTPGSYFSFSRICLLKDILT